MLPTLSAGVNGEGFVAYTVPCLLMGKVTTADWVLRSGVVMARVGGWATVMLLAAVRLSLTDVIRPPSALSPPTSSPSSS